MEPRSRHLALVASAVALALALSACDDSDGDSDTPENPFADPSDSASASDPADEVFIEGTPVQNDGDVERPGGSTDTATSGDDGDVTTSDSDTVTTESNNGTFSEPVASGSGEAAVPPPVPSNPATGSDQDVLVWTFRNNCADGHAIDLRFFEEEPFAGGWSSNGVVFPRDLDLVYVVTGEQTYVTPCSNNSYRMCYGADDGDGLWGAGINHEAECTDCCADCARPGDGNIFVDPVVLGGC